MSRTLVRQDTQIRNSDVYDDTLAAGATLESGAVSIEDDLNAIRSQLAKIIDNAGNWWDPLTGRGLGTLDTDLTSIEELGVMCNAQVLTDVTVPAGQNFVVLSVVGNETPTQVAAVAPTTEGAVVAQSALNGAGFAAHELIEITGPSTLSPQNLVVVRDSTTLEPIQSGGRDVMALLQYESTGADGAAFDDVSAGARAKISFVRVNVAGDDLEAVPFADIENEDINYNYNFCVQLQNMDKNCFLGDRGFVDQAASVDVTLANAIANQMGPAAVGQDIDLQLAAGFDWCFQDATGADLFCITEDSAGGNSQVVIGADTDVYDNNAQSNDFAQGVTVDSADTPISIGDDNAGCIETTGAADDLKIRGGQELFLDDSNQTGSTWAQTEGIKLSDTTAEWDDFETKFGEVSLINAICQAGASAVTRSKNCALVTTAIPANTDIGGAAGGANLDTQLISMANGTFSGANNNYEIFVNGVLVEQGPDLNADCDVYPGTSLTDGQLRAEFDLAVGDKLCVVCYA